MLEKLPPELLISIFRLVDTIGLMGLQQTCPKFSWLIDNDKKLRETMQTVTTGQRSLSIKTLLRLESFRAPPSERQRRLEAIRKILPD